MIFKVLYAVFMFGGIVFFGVGTLDLFVCQIPFQEHIVLQNATP